MSDVLTKIIVDCSTGEQQEIPLTADEIAAMQAADAQAQAQREAEAAEAAVKAEKRAATLAALAAAAGLDVTDVEAALS